ncbi:MAG: nucleoside phosphorylase [Geodermatophilaceae bacterium]|nr:nucleoside phosphorylase [Geodermatophilaceae bacterium]
MDHVLLGADEVLPLLQARVSDIAPSALVVGDPGRAESAARMLTGVREVGRNREYVTFSGRYADQPVTVSSHGVGAAGAAVCMEELLRAGVRRIIRAGTAGGLQQDVVDGDLVVATGAVRDEGTSVRLIPAEYPAVADASILLALGAAAGDGAGRVHRGVVLTADLFYPMPMLGSSLRQWADAGVVAVEMELAVLLVLAGLRGVAAGGVFAIDGNPLASADMTEYSPHRDIVRGAAEAAVRAGLTALTS